MRVKWNTSILSTLRGVKLMNHSLPQDTVALYQHGTYLGSKIFGASYVAKSVIVCCENEASSGFFYRRYYADN